MRFIIFIVVLTVIAEFRAEVHGEPTLIGCFIRGLDGIEDERSLKSLKVLR